ncbi:unnamed protein product, partial [Discosporangium mesarthrocarpum]
PQKLYFSCLVFPFEVEAKMGNAHGAGKDDAEVVPRDRGGREEKEAAHRIQEMDTLMRRKLRGGGQNQYHMKVLIRGERGVGKTSLWSRLQGLPFEHKYTPTREIQSIKISWNCKATDDLVKVEVWDVVDRGLAHGGVGRVDDGESLEDVMVGVKPTRAKVGRSIAVLDAGVVDVYNAAHAVIFMVDPFRPETLAKVKQALLSAPATLPALVILNFKDKLEETQEAQGPPETQGQEGSQGKHAQEPQELQGQQESQGKQAQGQQEFHGQQEAQGKQAQGPQELQGQQEAQGPQEAQGQPHELQGPQEVQGQKEAHGKQAQEPQELHGQQEAQGPQIHQGQQEAQGKQELQGQKAQEAQEEKHRTDGHPGPEPSNDSEDQGKGQGQEQKLTLPTSPPGKHFKEDVNGPSQEESEASEVSVQAHQAPAGAGAVSGKEVGAEGEGGSCETVGEGEREGEGEAAMAAPVAGGDVKTGAELGSGLGLGSGADSVGLAKGLLTLSDVEKMVLSVVRERSKAVQERGEQEQGHVACFECSMKDCFGLKILHSYLSIPFLQLKRLSMLQMAKTMQELLGKEAEELKVLIEQNTYGKHLDHLTTTNTDPTTGVRVRSAPPPGRQNLLPMSSGASPRSIHSKADLPGGSSQPVVDVQHMHTQGQELPDHHPNLRLEDRKDSKDGKRRRHHHDKHDKERSKKKDKEKERGSGRHHRRKGRSKEAPQEGPPGVRPHNVNIDTNVRINTKQGLEVGVPGSSGNGLAEEGHPPQGNEPRLLDPKEFKPVAMKSASQALDDFFGEGSGSDGGGKAGVGSFSAVKIAKPAPSRTPGAGRGGDSSDGEGVPVLRFSRLKRVVAPTTAATVASLTSVTARATATKPVVVPLAETSGTLPTPGGNGHVKSVKSVGGNIIGRDSTARAQMSESRAEDKGKADAPSTEFG